MSGAKPAYRHDCKRCRFLGQTTEDGKTLDLYVCRAAHYSELVARFGDRGTEYYSTMEKHATETHPRACLVEAAKLAKEKP